MNKCFIKIGRVRINMEQVRIYEPFSYEGQELKTYEIRFVFKNDDTQTITFDDPKDFAEEVRRLDNLFRV